MPPMDPVLQHRLAAAMPEIASGGVTPVSPRACTAAAARTIAVARSLHKGGLEADGEHLRLAADHLMTAAESAGSDGAGEAAAVARLGIWKLLRDRQGEAGKRAYSAMVTAWNALQAERSASLLVRCRRNDWNRTDLARVLGARMTPSGVADLAGYRVCRGRAVEP